MQCHNRHSQAHIDEAQSIRFCRIHSGQLIRIIVGETKDTQVAEDEALDHEVQDEIVTLKYAVVIHRNPNL